MSRHDWNIADHILYHLSFTSELIGIQEELMLQETCGLTLPEWRIMSVISSFSPITSRDITRVTTLGKVAVSRSLSRLTHDGLVERAVSDSDSRLQYLSLTKAGKQRFRAARQRFEGWSESLLDILAASEILELKRVLRKLRQRLGEITGDERATGTFAGTRQP